MQNSYDQLIYNSHPRPETHPFHLATIATLFGLTLPNLDKMRVLELGAGTGGNLIPMADQFPRSKFLGIDLSLKQVEYGRKQISALNLENIELRQQSILDFPADSGQYDFIICHGVFSWVNFEVQNKILEIFAKHLAPEGLGYLSYNTLPGWRINGAMREMMQYHAAEIETPEEQVQQAQALVQFLANSQVAPDSPYALYLQQVADELKVAPPYYLFHEYLESENQAFYFHEIISRLEEANLAYLGDAHFGLMSLVDLPEVTQQILNGLEDRLKLEQYLDFIRNRKLRESIICRPDRQIKYPVTYQTLDSLFCSAEISPQSEDNGEAIFDVANGGQIRTSSSITIAALNKISALWPQQIKFSELTKAVMPTSATKEDLVDFQEEVFAFYSANLIEFRFREYGLTANLAGSPCTTPLARFQAVRQGQVTSLRHKSVKLESITRQILTLLDGTRDRDAVLEELLKMKTRGELFLSTSDQKFTPEEFREFLLTIIDRSLVSLAKNSFFLNSTK